MLYIIYYFFGFRSLLLCLQPVHFILKVPYPNIQKKKKKSSLLLEVYLGMQSRTEPQRLANVTHYYPIIRAGIE